MARRQVVRKADVYRLRGVNWELHYKNRGMCRSMVEIGWNSVDVTCSITSVYPVPVVQMDGDAPDVPLILRQQFEDQLLCDCRLRDRRLLNVWYWSESGWMDYVKQFQSLPDAYEDYYWKYESEGDRLLLVPMSSKQKPGTSASKNVHLSYLES